MIKLKWLKKLFYREEWLWICPECDASFKQSYKAHKGILEIFCPECNHIMSTILRRQTQRNRIMAIHWTWVIIIPMLIIWSFITYNTFIFYNAPFNLRTVAIIVIVSTVVAWIYTTSRILYNYFTKGKPISFN